METVGVAAEYNPFHAGHRFHLAETRKLAGDRAVAVVMSGNFVQRGDCAIQDKWTRARAALEGGADLVVELPTVFAASSAETFAAGAVSLMRALGADTLSFGSESGDAPALARLAEALDSAPFRAALRAHLDRGLPFATCRQLAAQEVAGGNTSQLLARPNDNLAVEYLRAAARLGWAPAVIAVPRQGAGHDGGADGGYPSASWLRAQMLASGEGDTASLLKNERGVLSRLRALEPEGFAALPDCGEGLDRRLYRAVRQGTCLEEIWALAKTKRYAHARVRRCVLWAALGLRASDRPERPPYIRVLGAGERGRRLLRELETDLPIITKPTAGKGFPLLELESRCTDFYDLCRSAVGPCGREWTTSPIII